MLHSFDRLSWCTSGLNKVVFPFDANKLLRADTALNDLSDVSLYQIIKTCEIGFNLAEAECECEAEASAQLPHVRKIDINVKQRTKFKWEKKDMMGKATEVVCECEHSFD